MNGFERELSELALIASQLNEARLTTDGGESILFEGNGFSFISFSCEVHNSYTRRAAGFFLILADHELQRWIEKVQIILHGSDGSFQKVHLSPNGARCVHKGKAFEGKVRLEFRVSREQMTIEEQAVSILDQFLEKGFNLGTNNPRQYTVFVPLRNNLGLKLTAKLRLQGEQRSYNIKIECPCIGPVSVELHSSTRLTHRGPKRIDAARGITFRGLKPGKYYGSAALIN